MVLGSLLTTEEKTTVMPLSEGFAVSVLHSTPGTFAKYAAKSADDVLAATKRLSSTTGSVEFVDVEETGARMLAMTPSDLERRPCQRYTHCEIHPATILGIPASCIPLMHHNQAPRNVFSMAQSKQSVGLAMTNASNRLDTLATELHYPQRPLVTTGFAHRLFGGDLAYGENVVVAIASFMGYNQEDAVMINRDAVQRGMFNVSHYHTSIFDESVTGDERIYVRHPALDPELTEPEDATEGVTVTEVEARARRERRRQRYAALDDEGLPRVGTVVKEGDVLIGRVHVRREVTRAQSSIGLAQVTEREIHTDASEKVERGGAGVVDRVFRSEAPGNEGGARIKVRIRQERLPDLGDKFASRHGQKGVIGHIVAAVDMPFSPASGVVPDLVINPHAFPKRMTVGHFLECLLSKACVAAGRRATCNTFERSDVLGAGEDMETAFGLQRHGDEVMHNARTGEQMEVAIFLGPTYYMRLKHMVADKINHRSTGPVTAVTRQPTKGRGQHGGLRIGLMEGQALLSHGASAFLKESFMERSDGHWIDVDADSGVPARVTNPRTSGRRVAHNPLHVDIRRIHVPYTWQLLQHELNAMGIDMRALLDTDVVRQISDLEPESEHDDNVSTRTPTTKTVPETFDADRLEDLGRIHNEVRDLLTLECDV